MASVVGPMFKQSSVEPTIWMSAWPLWPVPDSEGVPAQVPPSASVASSGNPLALRQRKVAQQRRKLESEQFQKLSAVLPLSRAISEQHIDKTTVVRLAASYIRLHHLLGFRYGAPLGSACGATALIDIIDGFLLVLGVNADILYVSETISLHLGLSQVEMIGNPLTAYLHAADVSDFVRFLAHCLQEGSGSPAHAATFRVRCTLTKRSSKDSQNPNAGFKPLALTLCARAAPFSRHTCAVGFCQPHPVACGTGIRLDPDTFAVTTDSSLRLVYVDPHLFTLLETRSPPPCANDLRAQWAPDTSLYQLVVPGDADMLQEMHRQLFRLDSFGSPALCFLAGNAELTFVIEVFAFSLTSLHAHGNSQRVNNDRFLFICTLVG